MPERLPAVWLPFVRASLAVGLTAGFGLGALLFAGLTLNDAPGPWWPAAAQSHGHAQLFGWAGLMVVGIGLHFLPRLVSAGEVPPGLVRPAFWIIVTSLTARVISQPALAMSGTDMARRAFSSIWLLASAGEALGTVLLVIVLGRTFITARPLRPDSAIRPVAPFLVVAFLSLPTVLGGGALATLRAVLDDATLILHQTSADLAIITFYAFLTPVAVAMSVRLFPLYLRTRTPRLRLLRAGLAFLLVGLALRLFGEQRELEMVEQVGRLLLALATVTFVAGLGMVEPRRRLPRRRLRLWHDPYGLHAAAAYFWLLAAGCVQVLSAARLDAELHLLGAGFVSLLILGMGAHLLPGFARRPMRGAVFVWLTLILGNLATSLRIMPAIPSLTFSSQAERFLGMTAGIAGLLALACFAVNLTGALRGPAPRRARDELASASTGRR